MTIQRLCTRGETSEASTSPTMSAVFKNTLVGPREPHAKKVHEENEPKKTKEAM
jgi:hypothetical protein